MPYADPEQRRAYNRAYSKAYRAGTAWTPVRTTRPKRPCEECGEPYVPHRANQRFCRTKCRCRFNHKRRKAEGRAYDGFIRAQQRDAYRRRHNVPPERWRTTHEAKTVLGQHRQVDARPFAVWVRWWMATNDMPSISETARQLAVDDKALRGALDGTRDTLTLTYVQRALDRTETGLWELYDPDTLEPLA